ncbi:UDP-3-O-(3-hydroxymyristoyl)glucosamine N-acyltransferase [Myroides odoratimimus]|uniref:UDP-3-O-(3-hydroxymyristoyl)glucosamine N-acyltransferase n=1 Tax=Myroides odoratimimus TaxID=76832 RepID=UPI00072C0125|nr:UDP-3-O-(3-hydroxymyristoyl)glucosamine N-acyltransferase [Myroides odoratimimus]MDM1442971.1 UDP-3-O-(3-hydroxymyristoyl)glucosamine N-acyltransferase [Myroides odoratimimus]MDM1448510.1 UDP-3-O-(3-hydroxymyristoyl)glucosamine N-acyltransferase [Myroides odoratimimus]MDM1453509.1 UDP-3-O-(3-hydroxymyristoyl)glucosamine N-acyltransferase [Myroides odoratimimus]MDM1466865.1 UDP-3-O-(3-hydroxymyristoyl)glucosamine N-acyltransferase [Myroides odoratimimus]MDM1469733.1 UDP-3-O-(3-hydroxymyristo
MKIAAEQIASVLEGEIVGNPMIEVSTLAKIEEGTAGSISFLANPKYVHHIYTTNASVVIVNKTFEPEHPITATLIKVDDAYKAFSKLLEYYNQVKLMKSGIEQPSVLSEGVEYGDDLYLGSFAYIGKNVKIGNNVKIYPNTFVGDNVRIGDNTVLFAGVRIYSESVIGANCTFHAGVIIGSDGFGFAPNPDGTFNKVPQIGNVIIEDNVEIGAASTIDRATLGSTIIRKGVKLDNQIQIAHNVEIGENTVIASQTGVAGSTKIGKNCMIGGQVGIVGHLTIGDNVRIQAQSGVTKNLENGAAVQGSPALPHSDFLKSYSYFKNFSKIVSDIESIKKNIK